MHRLALGVVLVALPSAHSAEETARSAATATGAGLEQMRHVLAPPATELTEGPVLRMTLIIFSEPRDSRFHGSELCDGDAANSRVIAQRCGII